jgi:hypothetical protein
MDKVPTVWFPVIVSALPVAATNQRDGVALRVAAAGLLGLWAFVAAASIGLFYLPAVVAMIAAAAESDRTSPDERDAG